MGGPAQPSGGMEYPSLENTAAQHNSPLDYPTEVGLPPPVYPAPGYPPGYYPGPGGVSYDPYRPMKPPGTNGMAIAALVVALVSLFFCAGFVSIVSLVIGFMAMRETKRTGQDGWGLALAGVIVSAIPMVLWALYLVFFVAIFASGWSLV
ncbi:DUF4190 domain-containing protein [Mycobacterium deserti]|uniref:DUF4190 domain-containing protein n=1 Tax=Mycobacterium deserti TaxID=2978347 RepID=A0ABT2M703_9MYCO|nr:DUF4190 domain-containing protein [Mycobacterium deserti]MCT7656940.1 DUF4190 domain-containing protein [Mycobacterium deserti]